MLMQKLFLLNFGVNAELSYCRDNWKSTQSGKENEIAVLNDCPFIMTTALLWGKSKNFR